MFKMIVALFAFLQIVDTIVYIIEKCGTGFYAIAGSALFLFVCVVVLYNMVFRWI